MCDHGGRKLMCHLRSWVTFVVLLVVTASSAARADAPTRSATATATYTNPLPAPERIADPFVFREGATYYLYGTAASDGLLVWTSSDLVNWQPRGHAYRRTDASWARRDHWAPELFKHRGKYYLHFTANGDERRRDPVRRLVLAEADSPLGPFRETKAPWFETGGRDVIDGHVFRDRDGTMYLYWVLLPRSDEVGFQIHVRALGDDLTPTGESTLCVAPSEPWEGNNVTEGPFVLRHGDVYLMTYSAMPYTSPDYAVGLATARSPMGPWTKSKAGPILKRAAGVSGPGHHSFIESPDGSELFIVYHLHKNPDRPGDPRAMGIDRARIVDGGGATPTIKVVGPTTQPQPLPSGARR
jgi:beta-xylosidase